MLKRIRQFLLIILVVGIISCDFTKVPSDEDNTAPIAMITVSPSKGDTTMAFVLSGASTRDNGDILQIREYRWDLNGDSVWDTDFKNYSLYVQHFPIPGQHLVLMEARDRFGLSDTASIFITTWGRNHDTSSFIDPRDGQQYRSVRIKGAWWMAENLNFGTMIPGNQLPEHNRVYEKYCYQDNPDLKDSLGGYYTYYDWNELVDYDTISHQGLCPPGWVIPTLTDWDSLLFSWSGYGLKIHFGSGGLSGLNLTQLNIHELTKPWEPISTDPLLGFWMYFTSDFVRMYYRKSVQNCPYVVSSWYFRHGNDNRNEIRFVSDSIRSNGGALPVRCIKLGY